MRVGGRAASTSTSVSFPIFSDDGEIVEIYGRKVRDSLIARRQVDAISRRRRSA